MCDQCFRPKFLNIWTAAVFINNVQCRLIKTNRDRKESCLVIKKIQAILEYPETIILKYGNIKSSKTG
jgi:hypothetical protein